MFPVGNPNPERGLPLRNVDFAPPKDYKEAEFECFVDPKSDLVDLPRVSVACLEVGGRLSLAAGRSTVHLPGAETQKPVGAISRHRPCVWLGMTHALMPSKEFER